MSEREVGKTAQLYLGNILYALELAAMSLDGHGKPDDAAFYRGIARRLAEAHASGGPTSEVGGQSEGE